MDPEDLVINGELVLSGTVMQQDWLTWLGEGGFSSDMVRRALTRMEGDFTVRVNSIGGDPVEGEAIRSMLAEHPGRVTCIVEGQALSAASLLIMGADEIQMTSGSLLMIHDPSTCFCGTEAQLRAEADALNVLAETYAAVYAARAGMTAAEAREIMRREVWYGPQAAIDAGFADAIRTPDTSEEGAPAPESIQAAEAQMAQLTQQWRMCVAHFQPTAGASAPRHTPAAPGGQTMAIPATTQETVMPENQIDGGTDTGTVDTPQATPPTTPAAPSMSGAAPQTPPATPPAAAPQPAEAGATMAAPADPVLAERARSREIRAMAGPFLSSGRLTDAQVEGMIDQGVSVDAAGAQMARLVGQTETAAPTTTPSAAMANRVGREQGETDREGIICAMMGQTDGPAAQFRGMTVRGLAMHLAGPRTDFLDIEAIRRGMQVQGMMAGGGHGVSDFGFITTEVMNRTLRARYTSAPALWRRISSEPIQVNDFRELHSVRLGGDFELKKVKENGEYEAATLTDEAEGLKVERFGRQLTLTFEAVVNDDMGAFNRIPTEFADAAIRLENKTVWTLFRTNAVLKSDELALFHADHNNLSAAAALSVSSVEAARSAMAQQRKFGSEDEDDFLFIDPTLLIVPSALRMKARQIVTMTTPNKADDVNTSNDLDVLVVPNLGSGVTGGNDSRWFLADESKPPIATAYLNGYVGPTIRTVEGRNPDNTYMDARHIFGAAVDEFRGVHRTG